MKTIQRPFSVSRYGLTARLVEESDAPFIVNLRTDARLSRHISTTSGDVEVQRQWLADYQLREAQGIEYYFVIEFEGHPIGTDRLYHIEDGHFTSGSWVFSPDAPLGASILGGIICKEIAFDLLGMEYDLADIRKENKSVVKHHLTYKPTQIGEDELNYYYRLTREQFEAGKLRHIAQCSKIMELDIRQRRNQTAEER